MPIRIHQFKHTCALGAAMFAAVVAGIYPTIEEAMAAMGRGFDQVYEPNIALNEVYQQRYNQYNKLGKFVAAEVALKNNPELQNA
jgi:L-ribulokinase